MATRKKSENPKAVETPKAEAEAGVPEAEAGVMEQRVIALAEQLGRMAGTVERKTTGWIDRDALREQLTRVRDGATDLLSVLGVASKPESAPVSEVIDDGNAVEGAPSKAAVSSRRRSRAPLEARARSREKVAAPGHSHRKPVVSRPVKHSDERIPKSRAAAVARRVRRKG